MTFSCILFWKVSKEFMKWIMANKYLVPPPLKTMANHLSIYLFTFTAAPFRVLSWLTDDSFPWHKYWKTAGWRNDSEGPLCRIDTTISLAAIPLISYHHSISWFTHGEKSSFNIIQNFCKGNIKYAGMLLSCWPWSSIGLWLSQFIS